MTIPPWHKVAIDKKHDRKSFDCGQIELNIFRSNMLDKAMKMLRLKPIWL